MRFLLNFLLFISLLAEVRASVPVPQGSSTTFEATVVVHIDELDDAMLARLAKVVGKEKSVSIEYSCVASGIVVLKFAESTVSERADVISLAGRQLGAAGIEHGVEYLHVHAEPRGPGRC